MDFVGAFKDYYGQFDQQSIETLDAFYAENITFVDPIHSVHGRHAVKRYFSAMCNDLQHCRFEFVDEMVNSDGVWFKWIMHYQHPKLQQGKPLVLVGATRLLLTKTQAGTRIIRHEDFYDVGSMLYEHIPVLGSCILWLKRQLMKS